MKSKTKNLFFSGLIAIAMVFAMAFTMALVMPTTPTARAESGMGNDPVTYTVTFDLNGGEENDEYPLLPLEIEAGSTFTLPSSPELPEITLVENGAIRTVMNPEGKVFDAFEVDGARKNPEDEIEINKDTVIKYLWKDVIYIHTIKATIKAPIVGQTIEAEESTSYGGHDPKTQTPRPQVYVPENLEYYAYNELTYWYFDDDFKVFTGTIEEDTAYNALIQFDTTDEQYQFADDVKVYINGAEITDFDNMSLWVNASYSIESAEESTYTLAFDLNGGKENDEYPVLPIERKAGYNFIFSTPELPEIYLIENGFYTLVRSPEGKVFDAYEVDGERKDVDDEIVINKDTVIKYLWKDVIYIHRIDASIKAPIVGKTIEAEESTSYDGYDPATQTNRPKVSVPEDVKYCVVDEATYWYFDNYKVFTGKIEKDTTYNAFIYFGAIDEQYQFADDVKVFINGVEITETDFDNMSLWVDALYSIESVEAGLGAGAIVGIVIGSLAVLGGGAFCVYWFGIRKKRLAK